MKRAWLNGASLLGVALLALLMLTCSGCSLKRDEAARGEAMGTADAASTTPPTPVSVMTLQPQNLTEEIAVTGTLKPANEVTVGTRAEGRIAMVIGKEGTPVHRGEVVVRLEDEDMRTQLRSAQAAYHAAIARVEQAKAAVTQQQTSTDTGIENARAAVEAAIARLQQAKTTADATEATCNAQIKSAQATRDAAQAHLDLLKNGSRSQDKAIAESAVRLAKATYDNDKSNYDRYAVLYDQGAIARTVLDGAKTKMEISKAQFDSAQQQLSLVQVGAREEDIQAAEAAVRQAQEGLNTAKANLKQVDVAHANVDIAVTGVNQAKAALEQARSAHQVNIMRDKDVLAAQAAVDQAREMVNTALQNLDYTMIYSPVDGVISAKLVDVGQSMGKNVTVLRITTNQSLYFEANVSELEAPRLRSGQPVMISVDALQGNRTNLFGAGKGHSIVGTVEKVVPVVDASTRNFVVRVIVPRNVQLFPGMFARGTIVVAKHDKVVAIPKEVIVEKGNLQQVFVAVNGKAVRRPIAAGVATGNLVQIISGLTTGEQVITTGQQNLQDGDPISIQTGLKK